MDPIRVIGTTRSCFLAVMCCSTVFAQAPAPPAPGGQPAEVAKVQETNRPAPVYLLSPNDMIVIRAQSIEEISDKPMRIDPEGFLTVPIIGRIRAAGMTVEQLEAALIDKLKLFVRSPEVLVSVIETARPREATTPVFLVGAFKLPGVYSLNQKPETVAEMLMKTGGVLPSASRKLRIIRRLDQGTLSLPTSKAGTDGKTTSAEIALTGNAELANPSDDISLMPFDVLMAGKTEPVYVTGEVTRSGAYPLEDRDFLSATQALSLAGGPSAYADIPSAKILRQLGEGSQRAEIPINLKDVLSGRANDFPLLPNDVLYIPRKGGAWATTRSVFMVAIPAVITTLIYTALR